MLLFYFIFVGIAIKHQAQNIDKMIIDNINNISDYYNLHKRFQKACDYLKTIDINNCKEDSFEVDGDNIKLIISTNQLKSKNDALLETHKRYIDIHIPISGEETYGWKSAKKLNESLEKYDSENDFELFHDKPTTYLTVIPGEFVIFLSEDAHAPLIGSGELKKIIFKIAID